MSTNIMQKELPSEVATLALSDEATDFFQEFMAMRQVYSAGIKEIRTKLEILDDEFNIRFNHNPIHHMEYRLKSPQSLLDKATKKELPLTMSAITKNITDIAGVRVICNYIEDIYRIASLLSNQDDITVLTCKDYIKYPKANGYRSLHLVVEVPIFLADSKRPIPVEIQIRTIAMDFWASLEHGLKYKSDIQASKELQRELLQCANTITELDLKMQAIHNQLQNSE